MPYALLVLAVLAAYSNVYGNAFLYDDQFLISENNFLKSFAHLADIFTSSTTAGFGTRDPFYRPLQIFLYLIVYQLFGLKIWAFHALNVAMHALNACLVFVLAGRLGLRRAPALAATLLWAVHPLHTEAVTYMSATADPLHVAFLLGGLLIWQSDNLRRQLASLALFILALLSKEAAVVMPALLAATLFFARAPLKAYRQTWPLWLIAVLYVVSRGTILNFDNSFNLYLHANVYTQSMATRFFSFLATLPVYAGLLVAPFGLHMERSLDVYMDLSYAVVWKGLALLLFAALVAVFGIRWQKNPALRALAFGVLWFFAAYFPCTGIFVPVNAIVLEHWMYLPAIGLFLGVGQALAIWLDKKPLAEMAAMTVAGVVFILFALLTWQQNGVWRDPVTFYTHILEFERGSARVHNNLAMAYSEKQQEDLAIYHYQTAIEREDHYPQTHFNLGKLLINNGKAAEGVAQMKRAMEIDPTFYRAAEGLAEYYAKTGQKALARQYEKRAREMQRQP